MYIWIVQKGLSRILKLSSSTFSQRLKCIRCGRRWFSPTAICRFSTGTSLDAIVYNFLSASMWALGRANHFFQQSIFGLNRPVPDAIAGAIAACNQAGGGRVVIPEGEWLTGPIHLKSNVNLYLAEGAVLRFTDNPSHYLPAVMTSWEGMECYNYSPLIYNGEILIRIYKLFYWLHWKWRIHFHIFELSPQSCKRDSQQSYSK